MRVAFSFVLFAFAHSIYGAPVESELLEKETLTSKTPEVGVAVKTVSASGNGSKGKSDDIPKLTTSLPTDLANNVSVGKTLKQNKSSMKNITEVNGGQLAIQDDNDNRTAVGVSSGRPKTSTVPTKSPTGLGKIENTEVGGGGTAKGSPVLANSSNTAAYNTGNGGVEKPEEAKESNKSVTENNASNPTTTTQSTKKVDLISKGVKTFANEPTAMTPPTGNVVSTVNPVVPQSEVSMNHPAEKKTESDNQSSNAPDDHLYDGSDNGTDSNDGTVGGGKNQDENPHVEGKNESESNTLNEGDGQPSDDSNNGKASNGDEVGSDGNEDSTAKNKTAYEGEPFYNSNNSNDSYDDFGGGGEDQSYPAKDGTGSEKEPLNESEVPDYIYNNVTDSDDEMDGAGDDLTINESSIEKVDGLDPVDNDEGTDYSEEEPELDSDKNVLPDDDINQGDEGMSYQDFEDLDDSDSHFFAFLLTVMFLTAALYLLYHNKRKIVAFILPGSQRKTGSRYRGYKANYERLENKDGKTYRF